MKRYLLSLVLALILIVAIAVPALAATTQDVEVTATPAYISISNAPSSWAAGIISADTDTNTGDAHFTITNSSTVNIDISFYISDNWTSWTYGAPAEDTGQLKVSSANGGVGGSSGNSTYDITLLYGVGNAILVCDNVTTVTNPTWEMELDAPSSFTHGNAQSANVTMTAVAE